MRSLTRALVRRPHNLVSRAAYYQEERERESSICNSACWCSQNAMSSPIFLTQLREGWHQEVLAYWFGGDAEEAYRTKWFAPRGRREIVDEEVAQKFGHVLSAAQNECFCPNLYLSKATPEQTLALIVVLDQFSRHAYRGNRHKIEQYDLKALPLALEFLSRGWQRQLTASQHAFVLMPLRHQPNRDHLEMVLSEVDRREIWDRQQASVLAKFRRATLKSLQVLLDTSPEDDEILEKPNIACDESDVAAQKLTKTVMDYLAARRERCSSGVIVSLSGGVDSMVLTKILIHARQHSVISCIAACHVDYANRCESKRESEYLKEWCDRNGIAFRMRLVNSVKRGVTAREEYEEVSRKARYDLYKDVMEEFGIPAVLFGHHQGDLQENVISNIMRGAGLFNMAGMTEESVINGVTIWRPLLPHSKDVVYEFAHKYGVPYFKDTTPRWSTRGKLRRSLMPILSDMYGEGFASNLSLIARQSHQAAQWFQRDILGPFKEGVAREPLGFWVDIIPHRGRDSYFWSEALKDLLHSVGLPMLREKGLQWFINRIGESGSPMPTDAWIRLRSEFAARLQVRHFYCGLSSHCSLI
jgi:tRNA(Ile)-lysidine synthetase-like protein